MTLNESPSEKEGKWCIGIRTTARLSSLNESPSEKEGKSAKKSSTITPFWVPQ